MAITDRASIPVVESPASTQLLVEYYDAKDWAQTEVNVELLTAAVWRISNYQHNAFQTIGGGDVVKGLVRVIEPTSTNLTANWPKVAVDPNKNRAYAVQWFLIATAVMLALGFFLWHNMMENNKDLANGNGSC